MDGQREVGPAASLAPWEGWNGMSSPTRNILGFSAVKDEENKRNKMGLNMRRINNSPSGEGEIKLSPPNFICFSEKLLKLQCQGAELGNIC